MLSKNTKKNSPLDNKNNYLNYVDLSNFKDINYKTILLQKKNFTKLISVFYFKKFSFKNN